MISDEAVEAAVAAHCEGTMRAALEAAAPLIRAQALEDMASAILTNDPLDFWAFHLPEELGFQQAMSFWLKAHAAAYRSQSSLETLRATIRNAEHKPHRSQA